MHRYLDNGADISECSTYRYALWRRLSMGERAVLFVGLNPSTADGDGDDPTIRRCLGYARRWGYDWLYMGNLYALRSTNPEQLDREADPFGPRNQDALKWLVGKADRVVAAWGARRLHSFPATLGRWVLSRPDCRVFGWTKGGQPLHPLHLLSAIDEATLLVPEQLFLSSSDT